MVDYTANSHVSKGAIPKETTAGPKIEKVVQGKVVQRKKPLGRKVKDVFVAADFWGVARWVGRTVFLPAAKRAILDGLNRGGEKILMGDTYGSSSPATSGGRVQLNYSPGVQRPPDPRMALSPYGGHHPGIPTRVAGYEYICANNEDAMRVLEQMSDVASQYGSVTVAHVNQMMGFPVTPIDNVWGWRNIGQTRVIPTSAGYLLDFPPIIEI